MARTADWHSLYPFQSHEIRLDNLRYHYLNEGTGPILLLVHGNPTWSFYWREIVLALRGKFRLIVPDHIGCGLSDKPSAANYSYRLAQRVANLRELIEQLNLERITLVAHDWGGAIGMGAAVAAPERFQRFVLMNTAAFLAPSCPFRIRLCRLPVIGQLAVQGLNLFAKMALDQAVAKPERMTPAVRAGMIAPYNSWVNRTAIYRFVCDIPLRPSHPSHKTLLDIENGLVQFRRHPVCLIWGMQDWCFTPFFLNRFLEIYPHAEVHRLPDAAHYLVEDAHEKIIPIIENFMQR
ncbi:MAG TPA: alpha/beta fold hydrolase [Thermoguttaceae bacterium]